MFDLGTRLDIAKLIPHGLDVCLHDLVEYSDAARLTACSHTPLTNNALLVNGVLYGEIGIEYGAQAAAIHSAVNLMSSSLDSTAFIASAKDVKIIFDIDFSASVIKTEVEVKMLSELGSIYQFTCYCDGDLWCHGRLSLMVAS